MNRVLQRQHCKNKITPRQLRFDQIPIWVFANKVKQLASAPSSCLVLICLSVFLVRLAVLPHFAGIGPRTDDERVYNRLAMNLATTGDFSLKQGSLTSSRPPIYPATLSILYRIFGLENFLAVRLFQIGINVLIVVVVYFLAWELYNQSVAWLAAVLAGFYPSLWGHDYLLLTEVWFTLWLCLSAWMLVLFLRRQYTLFAILAGFSIGIAALIRSVMWPSPPLIIVGILCASGLTWRRRFAGVGLFVLVYSATIAPWVVRNTLVQKRLTIIDTSGGLVLNWSMYTGIVPAEERAIRGKWIDKSIVPRETAPPKTEVEFEYRALRNTLGVIYRYPFAFLKRIVDNFFGFWGLEQSLIGGALNGNYGSLSRIAIALLAAFVLGFYSIAVLTGIIGIVAKPPPSPACAAIILLLIGHICAVHTLVFGHSRYHIPVMVLLMVFSAAALTHWQTLLARQNRGRLITGLVLCTVLASSWVLYQITNPVHMEKVRTLFGLS